MDEPHLWVFGSTSPVVINYLSIVLQSSRLWKEGHIPQHSSILKRHVATPTYTTEKALGILTSMLLWQHSLGVNHEATQTMLDKLWLRQLIYKMQYTNTDLQGFI